MLILLLTLQQSVQQALEQSPLLRNETEKVEIARADETSARYARFPTLDFSAKTGLQSTSPQLSATEPWASQLGVVLSEPLYDGGLSGIKSDAASAGRELAELRRQEIRNQVALKVYSGFYDFSLAESVRSAVQEQQTLYENQYLLVSQLFKQGYKTEKEKDKFEAELERVRLDFRQAQNEKTQARAALASTLGNGQPDRDFVPIPAQSLSLSAPEKWPAAEDVLSIRITHKETSNSTFATQIAERAYYPRLDVTGGLSYQNSKWVGPGSSLTAGQATDANLMLTLSYNLWDWGTRRRTVESQRRRTAVQEGLEQIERLEVEKQLALLKNDFDQAAANLKNATHLLELEGKNHETLLSDYREGRASSLDLITGMNNLLDAKRRHLRSAFLTAQTLAKNRYYLGTIHENQTQ